MDLEAIYQLLMNNAPEMVRYVLMGLGALVVIGGTYVKMTPSKDDDAWFEKLESYPVVGSILKMLIRFSPVARKE